MVYRQLEDKQVAPSKIIILASRMSLNKGLCFVGAISRTDKHNNTTVSVSKIMTPGQDSL